MILIFFAIWIVVALFLILDRLSQVESGRILSDLPRSVFICGAILWPGVLILIFVILLISKIKNIKI